MKSLASKELTERENYKLLSGSIIPRPIALVSSLNENGSLNIGPFSFFNIVSSEPAIVSVSVQRPQGRMKDTARNILRMKEAVIHIVDEDIVDDANKTAKIEAPEVSELALTGWTTVPSQDIRTEGIEQAKIRLETVLYRHIPIEGDQSEIVADLFLLQVKRYHLSEQVYQNTYVLPEELKPMARLAGNYYSKLGERLEIKRPI